MSGLRLQRDSDRELEFNKNNPSPFNLGWLLYKNCDYAISKACLYTLPCQHFVYHIKSGDIKTEFIEDIQSMLGGDPCLHT